MSELGEARTGDGTARHGDECELTVPGPGGPEKGHGDRLGEVLERGRDQCFEEGDAEATPH